MTKLDYKNRIMDWHRQIKYVQWKSDQYLNKKYVIKIEESKVKVQNGMSRQKTYVKAVEKEPGSFRLLPILGCHRWKAP